MEIGELMDFKIINEILLKNTDKNRLSRGTSYYKDGYVNEINYQMEDGNVSVFGSVESSYQGRIYESYIIIDLENEKIVSGGCDCEDCMSRSTAKNLAICKHIVAITMNLINTLKMEAIKKLKLQTIKKVSDNKPSSSMNFINNDLLNYFKPTTKEKAKIEVNINSIGKYSAEVDFKIGNEKLYVLKDIKEFALARAQGRSIVYGKEFVYDPKNTYFEDEDENIAQIIEEYGMSILNNYTPRSNRYMSVNPNTYRRLMENLQYKQFTFQYGRKELRPSVIKGDLPIDINFEKENENIVLKSNKELPIPISEKGDLLLYKENIHIIPVNSGMYYKKLHSVLNEFKELSFPKEQSSDVLTNLLPKLKKMSSTVNVNDEIKDNITKDLTVEYYFDLEDGAISCKVKFKYDGEDEGKFIIRNIEKEEEAIYRLYTYNFEQYKDKYIFRGNDAQLYDFLTKEIDRLKNIGDVYYTDKFKEKKIYNSSSIKVGLGEKVGHYLEFDFKIDDISKREYKNIAKAFKNNQRFYKLGNGSFVNLEDDETKEIFKLMEVLGFTSSQEGMKIHESKVLYINNILTEKKLQYIEGVEKTKEIADRFKNIEKIEYKVPIDLKATLRDYQIEGLKWFTTLDCYGFGGILADEMGLGKTLQTISFLLSKKDSKSIVITPTSLIHNWKSEFEKFAPTLKIGLVHGTKKEREKIINNIDEHNVLLTTYGTLRNDLEVYEKIEFDYCVIDEAQNIKNPVAMSTDAVKSINSKMKFALTGTPIENNLNELWSIFDFIMPGYLYNITKFNAIFIKNEGNMNHLKQLIKPFILRRTKKQVIKELPDKIEKKFLVELNKDQRKLYGVYVNEVQEKLKEKSAVEDKITILSYLTRLRQLCLDPSVVSNEYKGKSAKIEACLELIDNYIEENNKILVFSQFTTVLKNIGEKLEKNNIKYSYLDGQTKALERINLVNEFNESKDKKVFLISLKAGGTGLNLTSASTVIHFDPWWNPSVENQASDRAHRLGQKKVVEVIKLIAKGTIEEKIINLQEQKKELIDDIIDGELSNGKVLSNLSYDEIIGLFN